jgi:hypothetical protein
MGQMCLQEGIMPGDSVRMLVFGDGHKVGTSSPRQMTSLCLQIVEVMRAGKEEYEPLVGHMISVALVASREDFQVLKKALAPVVSSLAMAMEEGVDVPAAPGVPAGKVAVEYVGASDQKFAAVTRGISSVKEVREKEEKRKRVKTGLFPKNILCDYRSALGVAVVNKSAGRIMSSMTLQATARSPTIFGCTWPARRRSASFP